MPTVATGGFVCCLSMDGDMPPEKPQPDNALIAYELYPDQQYVLEPAPILRDWMDKAHQRFPYRCLPLAIANQCGWILRSPAAFRAYWYGGPGKDDVEIRFQGPVDAR